MATQLEPGAARAALIAATVTPMRSGGEAVDLHAVPPLMAFLEGHGVDGVLVCGTTGEGVLLDVDERRAVAEAFRPVVSGLLIVHAGAQTTSQAVTLAAHAADIGADGVAVIAPPYYRLDGKALAAHFVAAARACDPLPFYCYEFAARSGYPVPVDVVKRVRDTVDNLAGLKVSDSPWSAVEPYLQLGLPVLIGNEPLLAEGLRAGAAGTISGVAAAFPDVVRRVLDDPTGEAAQRLRRIRDGLEATGQFVAAVKCALGHRGVPVGSGVRAPLRDLDDDEAAAVEAVVRAESR